MDKLNNFCDGFPNTALTNDITRLLWLIEKLTQLQSCAESFRLKDELDSMRRAAIERLHELIEYLKNK